MNAPLVSRGPMGLFAAIVAGGVSVGFLLLAMLHMNTPLVMLACFSAMPLYLAGLGAGIVAGMTAMIAGTLALLVSQPANVAVRYLITYGIPTVILIALSLRYRMGTDQRVAWYPEGKILTAITLYPCILFLIAAAAAAHHEGGLLTLTQEQFIKSDIQHAFKMPDNQGELSPNIVAGLAMVTPTLMAYVWIMIAIFSMAGAQYILRQQKMNLRDGFSLIKLHVPSPLIYGVAITGLLGVFAAEPYDYIGRNLSMILGLPFFFVGLAVLHAWMATLKYRGFLLFGLYLAMFFLPWIALFVAGLGVVDQWADFRLRIANKSTI